jgi:ABC-type nitrate/sulfonate/bicarbonate transport system permease component
MSNPLATDGLVEYDTTSNHRGVLSGAGEFVKRSLLPLIVCLSIALIFETLIRAGVLDARYLSPPSDVAKALVERVHGHHLGSDIWETLSGWFLGLSIAAAIAVPVGALIGSSSVLYHGTRGVIEVLRPIPSVAILPLVVLTLGSGLEAKVFLVALACLWPILIQTIYGLRDLDPQLIETARSLGMGRVSRLVRVALPGALPYVATGLRVACSLALVLTVTVELVIGAPGLGQSIALTETGGAVASMYALIVVTGMLGWLLNWLFLRFERRVLRWHVAYRPRNP